MKFSFHKAKHTSQMTLSSLRAPSCVCNHKAPFGDTVGSIVYTDPVTNTSESLSFHKDCYSSVAGENGDPVSTGEMLSQKNDICDVATYVGGLECCHHLWYLLDKDQDTTDDEPLTYSLKFRVWYQEYGPARKDTLHLRRTQKTAADADAAATAAATAAVETQTQTQTQTQAEKQAETETQLEAERPPRPAPDGPLNPWASHRNLWFFWWQTEPMATEYDVPKCAEGTPAKDCVHEITSVWQV